MPNVETYGFWGAMALLLLQNVIVPIANRIVPMRVSADIAREKRIADALGEISKTLAGIHEIQRNLSEDHGVIMTQLVQQGRALEVLLDRKKRAPH